MGSDIHVGVSVLFFKPSSEQVIKLLNSFYQLTSRTELNLNSIFTDIQFTMIEEKDEVLSFLDVLVCRRDKGKLTTSVFRKATNTLRVFSFNSNHPQTHKRSCVKTLFKTVETHCSTLEAKKKKFVSSNDNSPLMATPTRS